MAALIGWIIAGLLCGVVVIVLFVLIRRFRSYTQPPGIAFVRDDSSQEKLTDIVTGRNDPDTGLFADCASLSANIYRAKKEYVDTDNIFTLGTQRLAVNGWTEVNIVLKGKADKRYSGGPFGLAYEVWRNEKHRILAIVFRGTVLGKSSLIANLHWLFRYLPFIADQYDQIKDVVPKVVDKLSEDISNGFRICATGHSLGGGLAQHAVYLHPKITTAFAFNASPVTAWSDIEESERIKNVSGSKIYRVHETGEALEFLRLLMKIGYVFNPRPNVDPYFVEFRFNLIKGFAFSIKQHSIAPLACELRKIRK